MANMKTDPYFDIAPYLYYCSTICRITDSYIKQTTIVKSPNKQLILNQQLTIRVCYKSKAYMQIHVLWPGPVFMEDDVHNNNLCCNIMQFLKHRKYF